MSPTPPRADRKAPSAGAPAAFSVLDECHRQTLGALAKLEAVVASLDGGPIEAQTRAAAAAVVRHFSTTARQHHEDEERHVFPKLAASGDLAMQQAVSRLQQDHLWLEEDWRELQPPLDAIACGQAWFDVAVLSEGSEIFAALSREHIALEESCLYPVARTLLGAGEQHEMEREMTARRRAARKAATGRSSDPA
jgi:hemerythrin-like domain-containing protein